MSFSIFASLYSLTALGIISVQCSQRSESSSSKLRCDSILTDAAKRATIAQFPPQLKTTWVSERCEVRSGPGRPEYLVRRYHFVNSTTFRVLQYFYSDPDCVQPFYSIDARGTIPSAKDWSSSLLIDNTMTLSRPHIYQVNLLPYTHPAARFLQSTVATSGDVNCVKLAKKEWIPGQTYMAVRVSYESPSSILRRSRRYKTRGDASSFPRPRFIDYDCTEQLGFSLNELQMIRIEHPASPFQDNQIPNNGPIGRSLHLGDIPHDFNQRITYVPGTFQEPLYDIDNVINCPGCQRIRHSNLFVPPTFLRPTALPQPPSGVWKSERCEGRAHGTFLTRRLTFTSQGKPFGWTADYHSFHDPRCLEPFYSINAGGTFQLRGSSSVNLDSVEYDFTVSHLSITPRDSSSLRLFSSYTGAGCGRGPDTWQLNHEQNVTFTHGCSLLGLYVPETKLEILKMVRTAEDGQSRLYVGQPYSAFASSASPTLSSFSNSFDSKDSEYLSTAHRRPTAFQPALLPCYDPEQDITQYPKSQDTSNTLSKSPNYVKSPVVGRRESRVIDDTGNRASSHLSITPSLFLTLSFLVSLSNSLYFINQLFL